MYHYFPGLHTLTTLDDPRRLPKPRRRVHYVRSQPRRGSTYFLPVDWDNLPPPTTREQLRESLKVHGIDYP